MLKLSADDIIVSQKRGSNRAGKLIEYGRDYFFTRTLCAKFFLCHGIRWPLFYYLCYYQRLKFLLKMSAQFEINRACD